MASKVLRVADTCRICGFKKLTPILSLGELYVSDFLAEGEEKNISKAPLEIVLCNVKDGGCGLLQLKHTVDGSSLYRNYWYRSGMNQTMTNELADITAKAEAVRPLAKGDFVIDIGSNDGTLLRSYRTRGLETVGFEPAQNIVEKYGSAGITKVIANFFNFSEWQKEIGNVKAKIITAIAMFYDLDDPNSFVADLKRCLAKNGLLIIQMSYLPAFLARNAFDGICHEHLEYYSLLSLENLLHRHGLQVLDVELRDINEGSFRVHIGHEASHQDLKITPGAAERVEQMRNNELRLGLNDKKVYEDFVDRIDIIRDQVVSFVKAEFAKGKNICVYGASTKGNTLLQHFGLDHTLVKLAAERNPDKWGKKTVGTNIPIVSEAEARLVADYFLVLPWHFLKEFKEREIDYLTNRGKFIVPLPEFKVIGGKDFRES